MADMEAGRELDALVAAKVMGLSPDQWRYRCYVERHERDAMWCYRCAAVIGSEPADERIPNQYSTDMNAAWQVVQRVKAEFRYWCRVEYNDPTITSVEFVGAFAPVHYKSAPTAPLAICIAALEVAALPVSERREGTNG